MSRSPILNIRDLPSVSSQPLLNPDTFNQLNFAAGNLGSTVSDIGNDSSRIFLERAAEEERLNSKLDLMEQEAKISSAQLAINEFVELNSNSPDDWQVFHDNTYKKLRTDISNNSKSKDVASIAVNKVDEKFAKSAINLRIKANKFKNQQLKKKIETQLEKDWNLGDIESYHEHLALYPGTDEDREKISFDLKSKVSYADLREQERIIRASNDPEYIKTSAQAILDNKDEFTSIQNRKLIATNLNIYADTLKQRQSNNLLSTLKKIGSGRLKDISEVESMLDSGKISQDSFDSIYQALSNREIVEEYETIKGDKVINDLNAEIGRNSSRIIETEDVHYSNFIKKIEEATDNPIMRIELLEKLNMSKLQGVEGQGYGYWAGFFDWEAVPEEQQKLQRNFLSKVVAELKANTKELSGGFHEINDLLTTFDKEITEKFDEDDPQDIQAFKDDLLLRFKNLTASIKARNRLIPSSLERPVESVEKPEKKENEWIEIDGLRYRKKS